MSKLIYFVSNAFVNYFNLSFSVILYDEIIEFEKLFTLNLTDF